MRRKLSLLLLLPVLLGMLALRTLAAENGDADTLIRRMISYYYHYQEDALPEIRDHLRQLEQIDPEKAAVWEEIMDSWHYTNGEMPVNVDVLPDGLPQDDTLCIVVLGYSLNEDGTMKQELVDRLQVALRSAQKYPEAYILCTGGETSSVRGATEAGRMAAWLRRNGVADRRIIEERKSLSTTENAQNSYILLKVDYPRVSSIAVITSDYHIRWGCSLFSAASAYLSDLYDIKPLPVISNAVCQTRSSGWDSLYSQAWGISIITGQNWDSGYRPKQYQPEILPEPPAEPELREVPEAVGDAAGEAAIPAEKDPQENAAPEETPESKWILLPVIFLLAACFLWHGKGKNKTSGSD